MEYAFGYRCLKLAGVVTFDTKDSTAVIDRGSALIPSICDLDLIEYFACNQHGQRNVVDANDAGDFTPDQKVLYGNMTKAYDYTAFLALKEQLKVGLTEKGRV